MSNKLYGKTESYILYKRAKEPTHQLKLLAELNTCNVDDVVIDIADEIRNERCINQLSGKKLNDYLFSILDLLDRSLSYDRIDKVAFERLYNKTVNILTGKEN